MGVLKNMLLIGLALASAVFGWRVLRSALASNEQKIRWVFEDVQQGFDATRLAPVIGGFEPGFRDESSGMTRNELRDVLIYLFLNEHDPETKRFSLRMELDPDALEIEMTGPAHAAVRGAARFIEVRAGVERVFWDARFVAELDELEDGWQIVRTSQVNLTDLQDLD